MHGYWMRHRLHAPVPQFRKALGDYIILFVARMSFRTGCVCFWLRFHCAKARIADTYAPMLGSHYWLVCLVLLHAGTRAIGKSIDRPGANKKRGESGIKSSQSEFRTG